MPPPVPGYCPSASPPGMPGSLSQVSACPAHCCARSAPKRECSLVRSGGSNQVHLLSSYFINLHRIWNVLVFKKRCPFLTFCMFLSKAARVVALCVDERHELVTQAAKRMSLEAPAALVRVFAANSIFAVPGKRCGCATARLRRACRRGTELYRWHQQLSAAPFLMPG